MAPQSPSRILHTPILYRDKATRIRIVCNQFASISSKLSTIIRMKTVKTSETMVKMVKPVRNYPNPNLGLINPLRILPYSVVLCSFIKRCKTYELELNNSRQFHQS